jgi:beta-carotene ketolase (CrtW type)
MLSSLLAHAPTVTVSRPSVTAGVGLGAAALIGAAWLAVHLGAIFLWEWRWATLPLAALIILVQAWLSTGLFIVAHDAMHGSLAPGRPRLNDAVGRAALMIYAGLDYDRLRPAHFAHHKAPGTAGDPDFHPGRPRAFGPWLLRFFFGYYTHAQLARITLVACLYIFAGGASLLNIAAFWALPALLAMLQLFTFGTWLPHRRGHDAFPDRHHARSNRMGRAAALITCFNFGAYHHEHHLAPGVPWWALPQARSRSTPNAAR